VSVSTTNLPNFLQSFLEGIQKEIDREAEKLIEKKMEEAGQELKEMRTKIVAEYVLKVAEFIQIQDLGHELRISVKKD